MKCGLILATSALLSLTCPGADWPQWRGLQRNAISSEKIATGWPAAGPKVLWRATVGTGFSSITVSEGRAYTMGNTADQDSVWCFDASTGKQLWKHTYASKLGPQYYEGGPGSTPTVHSGRVYTISKWGDVFCLDASKGTVVWHLDLGREGIKSNRWGFAGAPLIWNNLVILNAGSSGTALARDTGRVAWSTGPNQTGYASPTLFKSNSDEGVLIFAAKHLVAVEPKSGRELWRFPWETGWDTNNSDPLVHDGKIFISSFSRGCGLLDIKQGKPEVIYTNEVLHSHLGPGVLLGEYLYAFNGEAKTETDLRCIHLPTAELKWTSKDPAFGSLICSDNKLLVLSEKGELLVAEASPAEFKPLARAQVLGGLCWTPPSLANGRAYMRNAKGDLVCLDLTTGR
jgi:outer membrane protein assembly factor BamB